MTGAFAFLMTTEDKAKGLKQSRTRPRFRWRSVGLLDGLYCQGGRERGLLVDADDRERAA